MNTKPKYVGGKEASRVLGVHQRTLYQWEEKGFIDTIRTPGGKRMYNVEKYIREHKNADKLNNYDELDELDETDEKLNISYARVSSQSQANDLERQKKLVKDAYPDHILVEDIGSGVNFNRRGLKKIIKWAIEGRVNELVIAYKDRLARFGYELIENLIKEYSDGEIIIMKKKDDLEPEEELMSDMLEIMNVFVAKRNGLRKYKKKVEKKNSM
jgi:putative resolvase